MTATAPHTCDVYTDPAMPFISRATDSAAVQPLLREGIGQDVQVAAIRVVRHKPGRRCLIEYDVLIGDVRELTTIVAKVRAKGADRAAFDLQSGLWASSFGGDSADGISVPRPLAIVPELAMWLQQKVAGTCAATVLEGDRGVLVAQRCAEAAMKLHRCGIPARRWHTPENELAILRQRLAEAAELMPESRDRLRNIGERCAGLVSRLAVVTTATVHRDFYPDQVLIDGERLYLLDLDLYAWGDPALDIGNFLAHMTEQSLRYPGDPAALADREAAMRSRFLRLDSSADAAFRVEAYVTLTLARHLWICLQFPERRTSFPSLLSLCETRLAGTAVS